MRTGRGDSELLSLLGPWPWLGHPPSKAESPGERGPKRREAPGGAGGKLIELAPPIGGTLWGRVVCMCV